MVTPLFVFGGVCLVFCVWWVCVMSGACVWCRSVSGAVGQGALGSPAG